MRHSIFPMKVFSRWYTNDTEFFSPGFTPVKTRTNDSFIIRFPIGNMQAENVSCYVDKNILYIRFRQKIKETEENETTGVVSAYQAIAECSTRTPVPIEADPHHYTIICCQAHVDIYFNIRKGEEY